MLVLPPTANAPLFEKLKPVKPGKRTVQKKGQPVERSIPEGTKRIPEGAYELIYYREKNCSRRGNLLQRLKSYRELTRMTTGARNRKDVTERKANQIIRTILEPQGNARVGLMEAWEAAAGREIDLTDPDPNVHLKAGTVFFTAKHYRALERKTAREFAAEQASDPVKAMEVSQADQKLAELKDLASKPLPPTVIRHINLDNTISAIITSGNRQERSSDAIIAGIDRAKERAEMTSDDSKAALARLLMRVGGLQTPEQIALENAFEARAAEVLADPNRGKIYIKIEPTPREGQSEPKNPFRAVIRSIVPPKKTKP